MPKLRVTSSGKRIPRGRKAAGTKKLTAEQAKKMKEGLQRYWEKKREEKRLVALAEVERLENEAKAAEQAKIDEKQRKLDERARNYVFRPNPGPQTSFLAAPEQEVLYGGAAGGGKTFALLADVLRYVDQPDYVALILRRTNDELREIIQKSKELYPQIDPKARWSEKRSEWTFGSGARIWMTYLDRDDDVHRYQGQAFAVIAFDELTHWPTPHAWDYLRSRLRTTNEKITPYMRATSNPGGVGHAWVKKMFVDPAPYGQPFWARDSETGEIMRQPAFLEDGRPNPLAGKPLFQRRFIPAKLSDNPYLANTNYRQSLMALPEDKRRALLLGDWGIAEGAAFPEFRRSTHVISPFPIDDTFKVFRSCDYGYGSHSSVLWLAVARSEQIFVVDEIYEKGLTAPVLAERIREKDRMWGCSWGILDSSCWHKRGDPGPSIAEHLNRRGCHFRPSDRSRGSRVSGKQMVHQMLMVDEFLEEPRLMIFDTCTNLISAMESIPLDKKNPEDVNTDFEHDHAYDALRYGVMSRPRSRSVLDFGPKTTNRRSGQPAKTVFGHGY